MGLVFIPVYIKYLGIEAYGLIGLFVVLQAWLTLFDLGLSQTLGREMARFTGGAITAHQLRDLLRSIEVLTLVLVASISAVAILCSNWLATHWINPESLSVETVSQALTAMGIATALKFAESIYRSSLIGLQRQVLFNIVSTLLATLRAAGAVGTLAFVSPTIQAFFAWQVLLSVLSVFVLNVATYRLIPQSSSHACLSFDALYGVWRFAGGMMGITLLALLLMQVDKILLSKLLTLPDFGYYTLAAAVAGALYFFVSPITQAFFPRFCELQAQNKTSDLGNAYHQAAQLVTVIAGSAAIILVLFAETFIRLWTQDAELAVRIAPILQVLVLGNLLNGLMWVPYQMQLAYGWTSLTVRINTVAVLIIIPTLLWVTPRYGAEGAAWVWSALNLGYLVIGVHFMYRRILPIEKWRWYLSDIIKPLSAALIVACVFAALCPAGATSIAVDGTKLILATLITLAISVLAANRLRNKLVQYIGACWTKTKAL